MKLRFAVLSIAALSLSTPLQAAVGYFGNFYVVTTQNGGPNTFNQVVSPANNTSNAGGGFNLASDGVNPGLGNFGTIDLGSSQSLGLNGFEYNTFNDGGDSVNTAALFYRVTKNGDTPGAFSAINLGSPTSTSGNNKLWRVTNAGVNLTNGLSNGNYIIDFYVQNNASFTGGGGGTFVMNDWNATAGPSANFTVIPEPKAAVLGIIGMMILLRRRK